MKVLSRKSRVLIASTAAGLAAAASVLAAPEKARPADQLVDSIGVNVHSSHYLGGGGTAFDNWQAVIDAMKDIGIRQVRDVVFEPDKLNDLTAQTGAKIDAIIEYQNFWNGQYLSLDQSKLPDVLANAKKLTGLKWLEGPNEYDGLYDPNWQQSLRTWQTAMYASAKGDLSLQNVAVIAPSLINTSQVSDLYTSVDLGNMHSYPGFAYTPSSNLDQRLTLAGLLSQQKPVVATETGYADRVPSNPQADTSNGTRKYMGRLFFEYFNHGVDHAFIYELLDQDLDPSNASAEDHAGLLRYDFTYKPSGIATKNLIKLLSDPGADFTPTSLDYSITGGASSLHHTLLQKRDGSFWLALWNEADSIDPVTYADLTVPPMPVQVTFGSTMMQTEEYQLSSLTPFATQTNVSTLNLSVLDEVMLVHVVPTPEPGLGVMLIVSVFALPRRPHKL